MSDIVAAILLTLAAENAELRERQASALDMLVETAIDAGNMYALVDELQAELAEVCAKRDASTSEAE